MTNPVSDTLDPVDATTVRIRDNDEVLTLDYTGAMTQHRNSLWWGTAVGYRAMQAAAGALSDHGLWRREPLYVVSGHPGPGVLDSIDYVTRCVERDRCAVVRDGNCEMKCNSKMKFEWWVSDGQRTAAIKLRPDFVPRDFYDLADRLFTDDELESDQRLFDIYKVNLSARIWNAPLDDSFSTTLMHTPLQPGEMPSEVRGWYDGNASM